MSAIPQPPNVGKKVLEESEPLKAYHNLLAPFFDQVRSAFETLTFKDNHGAVVTDATTVTAGADGALSGVFVAAGFAPLVVLFRAELLDSLNRSTGSFVGGVAQWSTSPRSSEQGFQVTKASGLVEHSVYSLTLIALLG